MGICEIKEVANELTKHIADSFVTGSVEITSGAVYKGLIIWACARSGIRFV